MLSKVDSVVKLKDKLTIKSRFQVNYFEAMRHFY
jgi:hypothetical protein